MCNVKPGARCSGHSKASYVAALSEFNDFAGKHSVIMKDLREAREGLVAAGEVAFPERSFGLQVAHYDMLIEGYDEKIVEAEQDIVDEDDDLRVYSQLPAHMAVAKISADKGRASYLKFLHDERLSVVESKAGLVEEFAVANYDGRSVGVQAGLVEKFRGLEEKVARLDAAGLRVGGFVEPARERMRSARHQWLVSSEGLKELREKVKRDRFPDDRETFRVARFLNEFQRRELSGRKLAGVSRSEVIAKAQDKIGFYIESLPKDSVSAEGVALAKSFQKYISS